MGAIAWVIVADPVQANLIITAMTSLGTIWSVGLSVLGIYVYKRSEDKRVSARNTECLTSKAWTHRGGRQDGR